MKLFAKQHAFALGSTVSDNPNWRSIMTSSSKRFDRIWMAARDRAFLNARQACKEWAGCARKLLTDAECQILADFVSSDWSRFLQEDFFESTGKDRVLDAMLTKLRKDSKIREMHDVACRAYYAAREFDM
jgi:hypothetical protein